jgi:hypothetical protein
VFILHHSALGGTKSSWRGNRIETGKNLNPVQKILVGKLELLGEKFPPQKMPRINTGYKTLQIRNAPSGKTHNEQLKLWGLGSFIGSNLHKRITAETKAWLALLTEKKA